MDFVGKEICNKKCDLHFSLNYTFERATVIQSYVSPSKVKLGKKFIPQNFFQAFFLTTLATLFYDLGRFFEKCNLFHFRALIVAYHENKKGVKSGFCELSADGLHDGTRGVTTRGCGGYLTRQACSK